MSIPEGRGAIVCVEDEVIILMHIMMMLRERYGDRFHYESAINAERGMLLLDRLYADGVRVILIVSDWMMPGMAGDEFIRIVRTRYPLIKAIMVSGKILDSAVNDLKRAADDFIFLSKPIVPAVLYEAVDSLVN